MRGQSDAPGSIARISGAGDMANSPAKRAFIDTVQNRGRNPRSGNLDAGQRPGS